MPVSSRTFRIFISSTFSDLKAERNALQERVFPHLRQLAEAHGCRFQAIDLRWGVSEEAALDQQTMKICLGEIERCQKVSPRPNFIVLLGERFGWRPLPYAIPAAEFERLLPFLSEIERDLACWQEGRSADSQGWYRRDDNAVPPEYVLLPRPPESIYADYVAWEGQVERPLVVALERAARQAGLSPEAMDKYTLSATGQEIVKGALQTPDAREHVFCFFRQITGLPQDSSGERFREADPAASNRQVQLKKRLKLQLPGNVHEYTASWLRQGPSLDHLEALCGDVYADLSRVMLAEMAQLEAVDPLEKENTAHIEFGRERARGFIGRNEPLKAIDDYIKGNAARPLVIWGPSGSGKSALLARTAQIARQAYTQAVILTRFIGATPNSSSGRALLEDLCRQITRLYQGDESDIPTEYRELVQALPKYLALAGSGKPLILFLDALDQISSQDQADELAWLPVQLPAHVRLVVSILPGVNLERLKNRLTSELLVEVQAMSPDEGAAILNHWLSEAGRSLSGVQRQDILAKFNQGGGLPLYLKLAFEEARRWCSYDGLPLLSDPLPGLSPDIPGILDDLFWRLEQESSHGQVLVAKAMGYLAAARNGLSEDEILDVLWADPDVRQDFFRRSPKSPQDIQALPVVMWSRLYLDLEPYLTWRQADGAELLSFYHRQVAEAVQERYCNSEAKPALHRQLAAYFGNPERPFWLDAQHTQPDRRKLSELAFQQIEGALWTELETTLCNLQFIHTKCSAGMIYDLVQDYRHALINLPKDRSIKKQYDTAKISFPSLSDLQAEITDRLNNLTQLSLIQDFAAFVERQAHILDRNADIPEFTFQQAFNQANRGPLLETARKALINSHTPTLVLRDFSKPPYNPFPNFSRLFIGHSGEVTCAQFSQDESIAITGSEDQTIRVWDLDTGVCIQILKGHDEKIRDVDLSADGKFAITIGDSIRLWSVETGACLQKMERYPWETKIKMTPDCRFAVSGSFWNSEVNHLHIWDLETGKCLNVLSAPKKPGWLLGITPDVSSVIIGGNNINFLDFHSGRCLRTVNLTNLTGLGRHNAAIRALALNSECTLAISGSFDKNARLWDLKSHRCLRIFHGHTSFVKAVALNASGKLGFTVSSDNSLRVWDTDSGCCLGVLVGLASIGDWVVVSPSGYKAISNKGNSALVWDFHHGIIPDHRQSHSAPVKAVAINREITLAGSVGQDKTVRLWDVQTGQSIKEIEKTSEFDCYITADGSRITDGHQLWEICSGKQVASIPKKLGEVSEISLDGRLAFTNTGYDGFIVDLAQCKALFELPGYIHDDSKRVFRQDFRGYAKLTILGSELRFYNFAQQGVTVPVKYSPRKGLIQGLDVSLDGSRVVAGSSEYHSLQVWDTATGECLNVLEEHTSGINQVCFSPDGLQAVSIDRNGEFCQWDVVTGKCLQKWNGHSHEFEITKLHFSPDGKYIVARIGSELCRYELWEIERGRRILAVDEPEPLRDLSFRGIQAVAADASGKVLFYGLQNLNFGPAYEIPIRLWNFGPGKQSGCWSDSVGMNCFWCGRFIVIADEQLYRRDENHPNGILDGVIPCIHCGKALRIAHFVIDNRDWLP
jgi:WD40 repeat protein